MIKVLSNENRAVYIQDFLNLVFEYCKRTSVSPNEVLKESAINLTLLLFEDTKEKPDGFMILSIDNSSARIDRGYSRAPRCSKKWIEETQSIMGNLKLYFDLPRKELSRSFIRTMSSLGFVPKTISFELESKDA